MGQENSNEVLTSSVSAWSNGFFKIATQKNVRKDGRESLKICFKFISREKGINPSLLIEKHIMNVLVLTSLYIIVTKTKCFQLHCLK